MAFDTVRTSKLLIDGDLILYRCSSATEHAIQWDDENWILHSNLQESKDLVAGAIADLRSHVEADTIIVCLSDTANFRKEVYPEYKSQRKETRKPIVYPELRKWVEETYQTFALPKLEADDVLGILATTPDAGDVIIASEDKDLQTIPCKLWRQGELKEVTEAAADYFWMMQTLTGDPTDGYKGCPGIGEKKAEAIIKPMMNLQTMWFNVCNAYQKAGLTVDDAIMNARLARILRHGDYEDGKVKLWEPQGAFANAA